VEQGHHETRQDQRYKHDYCTDIQTEAIVVHDDWPAFSPCRCCHQQARTARVAPHRNPVLHKAATLAEGRGVESDQAGADDSRVTHRNDVSRAGLKPLSRDLSPQVAEWARELRALFVATDLTISRFVRLHPHIDKGSVSRYLNGKRIPREHWLLDALMAALED